MKTHRLFLVSFLIVALSMLTGWRSHRHHHHKRHHTVDAAVETSTPKTLDLSLPLQAENNMPHLLPVTQAKSDFQIEKKKKIQRDLELGPQAIMSIEPEADKIKSFDGAGISINIKR